MQNSYKAERYQIPFWFSESRPRLSIRLHYMYSQLVKSLDRISRDFSQMALAHQTHLSLPVRSIFVTSENLFKFSSICNQMAVRDVFQFNPQLRIFQRKRQKDIALHHRRTINKIFHGIHAGRVHINYFFGKHCLPQATNPDTTVTNLPQLRFNPLINCLQSRLPPPKTFRNATTKTFRKIVNQLNPPPCFLAATQKQFWLDFWSLGLMAIQRNIMFRFIHKRISRKFLLHRLLPAKCTTSICSFCNVVVDSADRFIFTCPPKLAV
ncbi:hypothetical protein G6F43_004413 [Rhizopus delemar]|nr:hypothetical protein G6F43_004413 [Rhizopus delemar]